MGIDPKNPDSEDVGRRDFLKTSGAMGVGVSLKNKLEPGQNKISQNQPPNLAWQKTFGRQKRDWFYSVIEVENGYLATGQTKSSGAGKSDGWLVKVDKQGNEQWQETFGEKKVDRFWSVIELSDGYLAAGYTKSKGAGSGDGWLVKVDKQGNEQWQETYGGKEDDRFRSVIELSDGYLATGFTKSSGPEKRNGWLVKVDKQGNEQWQKTFGGSDFDEFFSVREGSDGYLAAGYTSSSGPGINAGWLVKVDKQGNEKWQKTFGGKDSDAFDSLIKVSDGYLAAGNTFSSGAGSTDGWLVKVDSKGNEQWQNTYGGKYRDWFFTVIEVGDGYVASGEKEPTGSDTDGWLVKVDKQGNEQWQETFGENSRDAFESVIEVGDGYLTAGEKYSTSTGSGDGWLVKLSKGQKGKTVEEVVANYNSEDGVIQFGELQQAINWWIQGTEVPGTGGKTIDFSKLQELIALWTQGKEV